VAGWQLHAVLALRLEVMTCMHKDIGAAAIEKFVQTP